MEKLVVINEEGVTQEFSLDRRIIRLGRDPANDVCLGDKSVSRHHASVVRVFEEYFLQDEKSTNGTRLNGQEIHKHILKHNDEIEIGKYRLHFVEDEMQRTEGDLDKTVVIAPAHKQDQQHQKTEEIVQRPRGLSDKSPARIRFLSGPSEGELQSLDRSFFTVGKPGGDLLLINRRHTGYFLLKMGGESPPRVNGQAVRAGGVKLNDGDRIQLGELDLEFIL
jgi:pSer/pThr/pTyr-binding forkhead associated (FHA) protein